MNIHVLNSCRRRHATTVISVERLFDCSRFMQTVAESTGNESVPKIIINDTINSFLSCNHHFGNFKP